MHLYPFRLSRDNDDIVAPGYPAECEQHTPLPDGLHGWYELAEAWKGTRDQRQCRGCGLWAIWEPRAIRPSSGITGRLKSVSDEETAPAGAVMSYWDHEVEVARNRKRPNIALQHMVAGLVVVGACLPLAVVTGSWVAVAAEVVLLAGNYGVSVIRLRRRTRPPGSVTEARVRAFYFDRQGRPISLGEWGAKFGDTDYKTVAQHWVRGWMVSTVWLGLDHGFGFSAAPVIFETMVFPPGDEAGEAGVRAEEYCERYPTEESAQAGHDRALAWIVEQIGDPAAAMEIMSAAQFGDPVTAPDDPGGLDFSPRPRPEEGGPQ